VKEKNKASFCQLRHCGSGGEQDLWYISATSFCLFYIVEHHVLKMTFDHSVRKNLFHISTNIPHFFRYIGWPVGLETDIVDSGDSTSHLIYHVFG